MSNKKTSEAGFTLIELMIVVVILAIISAFAYPSYLKSVQKSRRAEGKALLLEAAALQERRIADTGAYTIIMTELGYANPADSENGYYVLSGTATNGFTLTVQAQGAAQGGDTQCFTMSLNALGQKSSTTSSDCW